MDYAILGPLRVGGADGAIELKAAKQRALLAFLLLSRRDEGVPMTRLVDVLWGDHPPATATKALQVYVSQLRRTLGASAIVTRSSGYAIDVEPGKLDLDRFESLVARAEHAPPDEASALLREALDLFRGPPLVDAPLLGPAATEADRIDELRLVALERRIEADLALSRHAALVAELEALTAEHPYRERFHAQLMLALYRAGRQADALEAFRKARTVLVEELGLDPGRELQQLEAAILAQDPALDLDATPPPRAPAAPALPEPPGPLLGRDADLVTATALLDETRLLTLTGPGGIGKTRFALELAHRLGSEFADGARMISLGALDDPARVLAELEPIVGLKTLAIVDNFEQVLAAAPDLSRVLAASPGAKLIVTSRAPLRIAAEHELALGPLETEPAVALFERRARAVDPRLQLEPGDELRIEQICTRLDGLPLAIELAAARIKVLSVAEILDRLTRRLDLLSSGARDAPERQQTLRAAIGWSYDLLDGRRSSCSPSSACSPAASRCRPPKPSAAPTPWTASPRSPTIPCSPATAAATACSRPSANTRSSSSTTPSPSETATRAPMRSSSREPKPGCAAPTSRSGWRGSTPTTTTFAPRSVTRPPPATSRRRCR